MPTRGYQWWLIAILAGMVAMGLLAARLRLPRWLNQRAADERHAEVPEVVPVVPNSGQNSEEPALDHGETTPTSDDGAPKELNVAVPFTSQAPTGNWDAEHEELCEEASALMVGRFFQGREIDGPADAETAFAELKAWELEHFGFFESTTAEETARMIRDVYGLDVEVVDLNRPGSATSRESEPTPEESDPGLTLIKRALAEGKLVVVPAVGRKLNNPYFKQPGPIYHMLVIKGYTTAGDVITNDPGTKRGADYVYEWPQLFDAIGDWNNGSPETGRKLILIVSKS